MRRVEEELPIDERRFDALWQLTPGRRVVKTRCLVAVPDGLTAEVDDYAGDPGRRSCSSRAQARGRGRARRSGSP